MISDIKSTHPSKWFKKIRIVTLLLAMTAAVLSAPSLRAEEPSFPEKANPPASSTATLGRNKSSIWQTNPGEGFRPGTQTLGIGAGATFGVLIFGGEERHDLAILSASYGRMVGGVKGRDRWYQGNWELRGEFFGGAQFNSETSWLLGLTPHVRYHFATGSRWIPFADLGAGITLTDIREPDLGGSFQFNLQGSAGVDYFIRDDLAVNVEGKYIHISSAGTCRPNNGVNSIGVFLGINKFF